jgi:hypothetical protein
MVLIFASTIDARRRRMRRGNYSKTCKDCEISEHGELSCSCESADGLSWRTSTVSLNRIISNTDGNLELDR